MALVPRQVKLYVHTVSVYRAVQAVPSQFGRDIRSQIYGLTPVSTGVPCYKESAAEFEKGEFYGRRNREDTESLMDRVHFEYSQDIRASDILYFTLSGHPDYQSYYLVSGDSMVKNYRANKMVVYVKKITKPNFNTM